jgi:hypothetical protein
MKVPSKSELIHYKIQAALRENTFEDDQLRYLGVLDDKKHWYLIGGEHKVSVDQLTEFEIEYND